MANFFDPPPEEPILFNAEALESTDECVLCRDVAEVSVLLGAGVVGAVTVTGDKWLRVLSANTDRLNRLRKITLALPDGPMREEIARRLGRHRVYTVDRPICDIQADGDALAVILALADAKPYPIEGLRHVTDGSLSRLRKQPPPKVMTTGTRNSDVVLRLPTEGRLIIVTGIPSHGKTSWTRFVMVHSALKHNRRWCIFSPEMQPWEEFVAQCAEAFIQKPFYPVEGVASMTDDDIAKAEDFLKRHMTMLVCDAEDEAPTADWLFERARASVLRDGTTDFLVDPFNEVEQDRGTMSETDWIGRFLQRCKSFGFRHGCNVWIIAHPRTPPPLRANEKMAVPGPYSINGSSQWANKTDIGITIHSPEAGLAQLHLWKRRLRRWGVRGGVATMEFDQLCGVYRDYYKPGGPKDDPLGDMLPGQWDV